MFNFFKFNKKQPIDEIPLLVDSTNLPGDSDESDTVEHQIGLALANHEPHPEHPQISPLFIQAIKILIEHHQSNNKNKEHFLKFFENPVDLMRLLSINRETNELRKQNNILINFMISINTFTQFKYDMLNELHLRSRGPFDKLAAAYAANISIPLFLFIIFGIPFLGLTFGAAMYGYRYDEDLKANPQTFLFFTTSYQPGVGTVRHTHLYQPETNAEELKVKTNRDLAGTIGCAVTLGILLTAYLIVVITSALKYNKLQTRFNSRNNAEIKELEDAIRTTILNTTKEQSESPNYQKQLKHYIWNEKVNQPATPLVPNDVEAQPVLGV